MGRWWYQLERNIWNNTNGGGDGEYEKVPET